MEEDGKNLSLLSSLPGRPHQESRQPGQGAESLDPTGQTQVPLQNDPTLWAKVSTGDVLTEIGHTRTEVA